MTKEFIISFNKPFSHGNNLNCIQNDFYKSVMNVTVMKANWQQIVEFSGVYHLGSNRFVNVQMEATPSFKNLPRRALSIDCESDE